ncbi:hypothetical protein CY34DRAFT_812134 [Suillus luteus UH-Slu-Lm8-n1]|uniref:Uncharacterized protein n=1 Tax=Suillus luteus UH-Slu-Lm8-n1 TaxID=930992 RepID=A0A0D0AMM4_9AGAM|nr:hypothetical protein CY34DRAFT_812134 [Suillus luteus UH-Slu-Lm8-n1]
MIWFVRSTSTATNSQHMTRCTSAVTPLTRRLVLPRANALGTVPHTWPRIPG